MSKTIEIPDELYQQLEHHAHRRGVTLPQIIAAFVQEDEHVRLTTVMTRLQTQGVLLSPAPTAPPPAPDIPPIVVQGLPLSAMIIAERR